MGFKLSIVTVKKPCTTLSERQLLDFLHFKGFNFIGETTFEECMCATDNSINIGLYKDCLIICDGCRLSSVIKDVKDPEYVFSYEDTFTQIFPTSEIQTVVCNSVDNFHLYSLVLNGKKIRYKRISSEMEILDFGKRLPEEEKIYSNSKIINNKRLFQSITKTDDNYSLSEDQLMEEFTFTIAQRHLEVFISSSSDKELMFNTIFRKYKYRPNQEFASQNFIINKYVETKPSWYKKLFKARQ